MAATALLCLTGCGPTYPKCDTDGDCHEGEYCVNGQCQQCRGDEDCPAGHSCAQGACTETPGYCTSKSECGEGEDCENNICVTRAEATASGSETPAAAGPCELESVYFNYDSSELESSARDQLTGVAECIKDRKFSAVHLTGLTDPRGTEEYNLALGDRRAQSAKKYLKSLGVEAEMSHSSMGEEMSSGSDEAGWSRDRRVDFRER
ncbi:MAG: OmpA family protein [Myxococcales bacterium]|nr:OmpA family protein [Myxococcales bacterium]